MKYCWMLHTTAKNWRVATGFYRWWDQTHKQLGAWQRMCKLSKIKTCSGSP